MTLRSRARLCCLAGLLLLAAPLVAQQRALTFPDVMQFRAVEDPVISHDGTWVAFAAVPDRGDGEAIVRSTQGAARYTIARGGKPVFSDDAAWVAVRVNPTLEALDKAEDEKDEDKKPKPGLALLETATGAVRQVDDVEGFAFSKDSRFFAYHRYAPQDTTAADSTGGDAKKKKSKKKPGTPLVLRALATGQETTIPHVRSFAFDEAGRYLAYAVADTAGARYGLYVRDLSDAALPERALDERDDGHYSHLTWSEVDNTLAFLAAEEDEKGKPGEAALWLWDDGDLREAVAADAAPEGWMIPAKNDLAWTDDGARLFFGYRPDEEEEEEGTEKDTTEAFDPYDVEKLLDKRTMDVWHWDDPRISPQQKKVWKDEQARVYKAVYHRDTRRAVPLGDLDVQTEGLPQNARAILGEARKPYFKAMTWEGFFYDLYVIDLQTGEKTLVAERLEESSSLSPEGRYATFYRAGDWHLYDAQTRAVRNLTAGLDVPFADEDHDYPSAVPGYGVGGWVENDDAVLIYDKYDVWQVPTDGSAPFRLTDGQGRADQRIFRVVKTDPDQRSFEAGEDLLLEGYHDMKKSDGFYRAQIGQRGVQALMEKEKLLTFMAKAEEAPVLLFTQEDYDEFPDLWVAGPDLKNPRKITNVNPQMADFAWGTSELIEWQSLDGTPMQGVVIKPNDYDPSKRYPVVVYYYRFFSQRLHEFNQPRVNHRPAFPLYASNGYVLFLPDVRFEVSRPGFAATKSVVPGVQKLIDLGIADPDRVGLHGHSWSGYQTAFIVTQTDLFAAAIAGAPVSNMTSAYGGIRWGSGLARQFQYEMTQSRLGASLWEGRDRYIENSPLFFVDHLETPLLIIHGDDDGAVPWYQSIELYLACRRLEKECIFLQYRGEDHHPAKYPNKLDWAVKMKEYFDHYLKDAPAPPWIEEGVPYAGD